MSNNSVQLLYEDVKRRFQKKYILTYRLNQDVLENFFGAIRSKGGLYDHPDAIEFKYRLRSYILGRNEGSFSAFGNVEEDKTPNLPLSTVTNLSGQMLSKIQITEQQTTENEEFPDLVSDSLEHLAGFVCYKLQENNSSISTASSYTWTSHLSEGGLTKPSDEFLEQVKELEKIFIHVNGDDLATKKNYMQELLSLSSNITCSEKAKKTFYRCRMYFRMRQLNKNIADQQRSRKRKNKKILT